MCVSAWIYIQRLAAGEWFTARVSACGLFHIAYPSAPEMLKTELRSIYGQLCQDDMPMVRRSAATNLGKFAATIEPAHLKTDIMTIFEDLTQDGNSLYPLLECDYFSGFLLILNSCEQLVSGFFLVDAHASHWLWITG